MRSPVVPLLLIVTFIANISSFVKGDSSFLDDSLDDFLHRFVKDEEQNDYRSLYSQFLEKQSKKRLNSKRHGLRRVRARAFNALQKEYYDLYKQIEPFILEIESQTEISRKIRLFLTRFSLLIDYRQNKDTEEQGWIKTFTGKVKKFVCKIHIKNKLFNKQSSKAKA